MVDEESTAIAAKKHLIRHTHNARMTPSPAGEGFYLPCKMFIASPIQAT
jgi:hypothetical protein